MNLRIFTFLLYQCFVCGRITEPLDNNITCDREVCHCSSYISGVTGQYLGTFFVLQEFVFICRCSTVSWWWTWRTKNCLYIVPCSRMASTRRW